MSRATNHLDLLTGRPGRAGLSLLEVLIACGVLALGLGGVAALLPAAGQRFGAAIVADRARFVAANGHADMLSRGLASAAACPGNARAFVFGPALVGAASAAPTVVAAGSLGGIDAERFFVAEDDVVFEYQLRPVVAGRMTGERAVFFTGGPQNVFNAGGLGPRRYRDSIVWGATIVPVTTPAQPGTAAVLSIVVLRRSGEPKRISLVRNADGTYQCPEADRLQRLTGCSSALVVAVGGADVARPAWVSVRASWPGNVALDTEALAPEWQGQSLVVIGFEGVVRVEHHLVTLQ
jgi:hypothetical protein